MNRIPTLSLFLSTLLMLGMLTGVVGCQHGKPATTPDLRSSSGPSESPLGEGVNLGYFQFVFDDKSVTVEPVDSPRGSEINVTQYAIITIEDFFFDEPTRNWNITASIKNTSIFTGYDVWAVFHSLGNKFVYNPDGFIWALPPMFPEPTRCAFVAYGKNQQNRIFPPMFKDTRTILIHQPEGVPKLAPIGFWIDATLKPRVVPAVEDLMVTPIDDTNYHLTGYIWDHQSPSSQLTVWADTSKFNGINSIPMYDDGAHGDGAAGDNIFGCDFSGNPDEGFYRITVYAFDPQQHSGENDAWFQHGQPCDEPFEHFKFDTIDKGEHSGIKYKEEAVINSKEVWEYAWTKHTSWIDPPPPIPPIDFENCTVIGVWAGDRPTNNHMVTITDIYLDPCEKLVTVLYDYTPYIGCGPLDVITDPYHIVVLPKIEWPVYFVGTEVDCPPPPPECMEDLKFDTVIQGIVSGIKEPYQLKITNWEQFHTLWVAHTSNQYPPPPPPEINFDEWDVIAVGIGQRPTGGFECIIDRICILADNSGAIAGLGVFYRERIPGPNCAVPDIITQPYHWVLIPKSDDKVQWFPSQEVYNCPDGGCQPVDHFYKADGPSSCEPAEQFPMFNIETLTDVWHGIWCGTADMPPVPEIYWEKEIPFVIQDKCQSTSGFYLTVDAACVNYEEKYVQIDYTRHIPGSGCPVEQVITYPWIIESIPWFDGAKDFKWNFVIHEEVYTCPDCAPVLSQTLEEGTDSCVEPGEYGFQGFGDDWHKYWYDVHCWNPDDPGYMPGIPGADPGYAWIPFLMQLGERPTTGYYLVVDNVCIKGCHVYVNYTEYIPGVDCEVEQVITKPWLFSIAQLPLIDCEYYWFFTKSEVVYDCNEPCNKVPFYQLVDGGHSCAQPGEYGFQYEDGYYEFWKQVNCTEEGQQPPPLPEDPKPVQDGIIYHFGVQLDGRPSTGYYLTFDEVCIDGCDVYIKYTEHIPGPDCEVLWVETQPWAIGAVELPPVYCYWTWHFEKSEEIYNCPDEPCWGFEIIAEGTCDGEEPGGWFFDNQLDFHKYWVTYHPQLPIPNINFDGGWGAYAVHVGERPTSGYSAKVYEICQSEDPFGAAVRWYEMIPGKTCDVEQIITGPWQVVTMPLVDLPYFDERYENVYECD